jgi:hypothetical protein
MPDQGLERPERRCDPNGHICKNYAPPQPEGADEKPEPFIGWHLIHHAHKNRRQVEICIGPQGGGLHHTGHVVTISDRRFSLQRGDARPKSYEWSRVAGAWLTGDTPSGARDERPCCFPSASPQPEAPVEAREEPTFSCSGVEERHIAESTEEIRVEGDKLAKEVAEAMITGWSEVKHRPKITRLIELDKTLQDLGVEIPESHRKTWQIAIREEPKQPASPESPAPDMGEEYRVADALPMDLGFDNGPADRPWNVELWGPRPSKDLRLVPKSRLEQVEAERLAAEDRADGWERSYRAMKDRLVGDLILARDSLTSERARAKKAETSLAEEEAKVEKWVVRYNEANDAANRLRDDFLAADKQLAEIKERLEGRVLRTPEPTPKQQALMEEFSDEMPTWAQLAFVQSENERMREAVRQAIGSGADGD